MDLDLELDPDLILNMGSDFEEDFELLVDLGFFWLADVLFLEFLCLLLFETDLFLLLFEFFLDLDPYFFESFLDSDPGFLNFFFFLELGLDFLFAKFLLKSSAALITAGGTMLSKLSPSIRLTSSGS